MLTAVRELCEREGLSPAEIGHLFHGTTIATNAVLTYDGARTGMITSGGLSRHHPYRRHQRPQHYSIRQEIPWQDRPLVRRRHRLTVPERIAPPAGAVLTPLDEAAVRRAARRLREDGVEAIAVCFLYSWIDPAHEERAAAIVREEHPECFVTTSASVSPQFREFERFTTTAMNAFIGPRCARLHAPDRRPHGRCGGGGGASRHELQRRRRNGADGGRTARRHLALGARGRGARRAVDRRAFPPPQAHYVRHGRDVRRHRHRRRRPVSPRRPRATPGSPAIPCSCR